MNQSAYIDLSERADILIRMSNVFIDIHKENDYNKNVGSMNDRIHVLRGVQSERCLR